MRLMKRNHFLVAMTGAAALVAAVGAQAQQGGVSALKGHNSKAPIDLAADHAEAQDRADRAIFSGNVVIKQDELTLRTARLTMAYSNGAKGLDLNRVDASGGVVITSPSETAKGDFGSYDLNAGLITVVGNVRLERNGSFLNGARLTIDTKTGRATMDGGPAKSGGRVTGRFTVPQGRS